MVSVSASNRSAISEGFVKGKLNLKNHKGSNRGISISNITAADGKLIREDKVDSARPNLKVMNRIMRPATVSKSTKGRSAQASKDTSNASGSGLFFTQKKDVPVGGKIDNLGHVLNQSSFGLISDPTADNLNHGKGSASLSNPTVAHNSAATLIASIGHQSSSLTLLVPAPTSMNLSDITMLELNPSSHDTSIVPLVNPSSTYTLSQANVVVPVTQSSILSSDSGELPSTFSQKRLGVKWIKIPCCRVVFVAKLSVG
ncbi:hypothetical protein LINGRAHAP2_LOCUS32300 [Linum grandiflorum]